MLSNSLIYFLWLHYVKIDPSNTFRLVVKVLKFVVDGEYGLIEMADQEHELWLDRNLQYSLEKFYEEMATKIIWGPSQTLAVWVLDTDSGFEWKVRSNEHFQQLIKDRWADMVAFLVVDVVSKHGESVNASSGRRCVSGVTTGEGSGIHGNGGGRASNVASENVEGTGDTCSTPPSVSADIAEPVDWANLTILPDDNDDGCVNAAADEDKVYEAMGFKTADERIEEAAREVVPIPTMTAEMQNDMDESSIPVDDNVPEEPMFQWNRDNPDMSVGVCYPSMDDFRLAVRQHAIVKEFELATAHSNT